MNSPARQAFIGGGANLGDRAAALRSAAQQLRAHPQIMLLEASPVYETEPVGPVAQPKFLNLVMGVETSLAPEALLGLLLAIEKAHGRVRAERWGPRVLDLDLLTFENETRASPELQLPHPRLLERGFVTVPLRVLLARPRFQNTAWDSLRTTLAALPAPAAEWQPVDAGFAL